MFEVSIRHVRCLRSCEVIMAFVSDNKLLESYDFKWICCLILMVFVFCEASRILWVVAAWLCSAICDGGGQFSVVKSKLDKS
jgi:hypothetical protein